ncbi:hypothetical protein FISHEDRAFT_78157 [Fistulina hepatica ATCC 64428]|nr:hypothetical protein FISHEDRAFT_78157 [Fistulina hepatica ATCC 64428]
MDASRSSRTPSSLVPASLQISRERAARDMVHEITELPLEEVFSNYLPPVLQADIDECHSRLQQSGVIANGHFALEVTKSTVPEAIRKKTEFVGKIFSADVAANGEVKRANDFITRYEDAKKAVHGAVHYMSNKLNPMEVTIENTQMRIWFYSRSHSVVSEPFNFVEDTKSFVRFVLAFGFASPAALGYDPSKPDLGIHFDHPLHRLNFRLNASALLPSAEADARCPPLLRYRIQLFYHPLRLTRVVRRCLVPERATRSTDPTVKRCCDESGQVFYVFEIVEDETKHYFRTIRVLSDYCAARIPGRGTRVFLVRRCSSFNDTKSTGDDAVLRDFWLDERALPEWTIQADIFNRLEELKKVTPYPEWLKSITNHEELMSLITTGDYKKYFMTILQHGEVRLGGARDYARGLKRKNVMLSTLLRDYSQVYQRAADSRLEGTSTASFIAKGTRV